MRTTCIHAFADACLINQTNQLDDEAVGTVGFLDANTACCIQRASTTLICLAAVHKLILRVAVIKGWDVPLHGSKTCHAPCFYHELQRLIHQVHKNHPAARNATYNASTASTPSQ